MDFITNLSLSMLHGTIYNTILIIINYFIKLSTFILYKKNINAEELTDLITKKIFNIYKYPDSIIFNRGLFFTSRF